MLCLRERPLRFGLTFEPPTLAVEFEGQGVLQIALPGVKTAPVEEVVQKLLRDHGSQLNVATVSFAQLRRLVQKLAEFHLSEPSFKVAVKAIKKHVLKSRLVKSIDARKRLHPEAPKQMASCLPCYLVTTYHTPTTLDAAVFFADISGFTKLTEKLNRHLDGAERLCAELDKVYTMILDEADTFRGDAVKFAGDAILFMFVEEERGMDGAVRRAAACSSRVHRRIQSHPAVEGVKLTLHAGLAAGRITCLAVGTERAEFVIAGPPMKAIGVAEPLAGPGETVADPVAWRFLRDVQTGQEPLTKVHELSDDALGFKKLDDDFSDDDDDDDESQEEGTLTPPTLGRDSQDLAKKRKRRLTDTVSVTADDVKFMAPFIPPAFERVLSNRQSLQNYLDNAGSAKAEIRELTVCFLKISGVDLSNLKEVDASQAMMLTVQASVVNFGGSVNKLLVDDKGTLAVLVFGLPGQVHDDSALRAVCAVLEIQQKGVHCFAGLTTGSTFAGVVGSDRRKEYTVMGDTVNLAARLMASCITNFGAVDGQSAMVVCERTCALTKSDLEYHDMSPIHVKGKKNKVHVFIPEHFRLREPRLPPLDLRFRSRKLKRKQIDDVLRRYAKGQQQQTSPKRASVLVIVGVHGADANYIFGTIFDDLCPKHGLHLLPSLRSRSVFHDGLLQEQTTCGAWRGPVLRAVDLICGLSCSSSETSSSSEEKHFFYPANDPIVGPCWGQLLQDNDDQNDDQNDESTFFVKQRQKRHQFAQWSDAVERHKHHAARALHSSEVRRKLKSKLPPDLVPHLPLLDDMFLEQDRVEDWGITPSTPPLRDVAPALRDAYLAQLVICLLSLAAREKKCVVVLDNVTHMDDASWRCVYAIQEWHRRRTTTHRYVAPKVDPLAYVSGGFSSSDSSSEPPLLCFRGFPLSLTNKVEYANAVTQAEEKAALVEIGSLDEDEAMEFVAYSLGIAEEDAGIVRDCDQLVKFARQADGKQRLLDEMLKEAQRFIQVVDDDICIHKDLLSLPAPARYKKLLLAQMDTDLPPHKQILIRAAASLKDKFSSRMLMAFAPFKMDSFHVKSDLEQLCEPLGDGFHVFKRCAEKPAYHGRLPFSAEDDVYYDFQDPLARTAVADTLLENHVQFVLGKINELPGKCGPLPWEAVLVHPYVLARRRRWDRTARCLKGLLKLAHTIKHMSRRTT